MSTARIAVAGWPAFDAAVGQNLLVSCESQGIPMESACGGFACCNSCRVELEDGAALLSPRNADEAPFLDAPTQRLGCQAVIAAEGRIAFRLAPGA